MSTGARHGSLHRLDRTALARCKLFRARRLLREGRFGPQGSKRLDRHPVATCQTNLAVPIYGVHPPALLVPGKTILAKFSSDKAGLSLPLPWSDFSPPLPLVSISADEEHRTVVRNYNGLGHRL